MMELPESNAIATAWNANHAGSRITKVETGLSPHKFFFTNKSGPPCAAFLEGRTLGKARPLGIYIEFEAGENAMLVGEGLALRWLAPGQPPPAKRQLHIHFEDGSALVGGVQMYGGVWAYPAGTFDNPYYIVATEKPSPFSDAFDRAYFDGLLAAAKPTLSVKALLATEQRIPGLGNGVLQDILLDAGIHPKRKCGSLSADDVDRLYAVLKADLAAMEAAGGRDTEKNLYGDPGGYTTLLSAKTWKAPCPKCGATVQKQNYLGGSIYFCPACQPLP